MIYGLYGASFLVGITSIVAIILNYVKRGDVAGTYLESHFTWQIRTFWISVIVAIVGALADAGAGRLAGVARRHGVGGLPPGDRRRSG